MKSLFTLFALLVCCPLPAWCFTCSSTIGGPLPEGGGSADIYVNLPASLREREELIVDLSRHISCRHDATNGIQDFVTLQKGELSGSMQENFTATINVKGQKYSSPIISETQRIVYDEKGNKPLPVSLSLKPLITASGIAIRSGSQIASLVLHQTSSVNAEAAEYRLNIFANNDMAVPTGGCEVSARDETVKLPWYPHTRPLRVYITCKQPQRLMYYLTGATADGTNDVFRNVATDSPATGMGISFKHTRGGATAIPVNTPQYLGEVGSNPFDLGITVGYGRTREVKTAGNVLAFIGLTFVYP